MVLILALFLFLKCIYKTTGDNNSLMMVPTGKNFFNLIPKKRALLFHNTCRILFKNNKIIIVMTLLSFLKFKCTKKTHDFSAQFDQSCLTWEPSDKVCGSHGPIKFIREDFGGCTECNDKWRAVVFPTKIK